MRKRFINIRRQLEDIEERRNQVARLRRNVKLLEEKCTAATSRYGWKTTSDGLSREELLAKLCDRQESLKRQETALREREETLIQWIDQLPRPRWRMVLRCRYLDGMTMQEIADDLTRTTGRPFSVYQIYRLHSAALGAAEELWMAD